MLPMIPLEVDEVVAILQHTKQAMRNGEKFWDVFWKGGPPMEMNKDERSPQLMQLPKHFGKVLNASAWGMSAPWTLIVSTLLGIGLMGMPGQVYSVTTIIIVKEGMINCMILWEQTHDSTYHHKYSDKSSLSPHEPVKAVIEKFR